MGINDIPISRIVPDAGLGTATLDGNVGSVAIEELFSDLPRHLFRRRADLDQFRTGAHRSGKLPITAHLYVTILNMIRWNMKFN